MKIIIAGCRDFVDYERFCRLCAALVPGDAELVTGGAPGTDALAVRYARERDLRLRVFRADWALHGKLAGPIRNREMAAYGDRLIAFWDGKSRGTKDMIRAARKAGIGVKVVVI